MNDSTQSLLLSWHLASLAVVFLYRAAMAALLEAFHALSSLQRRRILEEGAIQDLNLARLLERPHALGLGITLWNQCLLLLLLGLLWPLRVNLPGGTWTLVALTLAYVWALDLALPTLLAAREPFTWIRRIFPFYAPAHRLVAPLVAPLARYVERQREALDRVRDAEDETPSDDAVTALLEEGEAEGILEEEDRELIRNVVSFGDTVVREVMTPRTAIQAVDLDATPEEIWAVFRAGRHSRLPIYDGGVDRVVGVLLLKDLLQWDATQPLDLRGLAKEPHFVPESKPIPDLLKEMQRVRTQLAIVVDEFGSVSGLVTVEDLLEEVFGEIQDEHEPHAEIRSLGPNEFLVPGAMHLEDLEAGLGLHWEREGFDTLGGLVMARLGRIPKPEEAVAVEGALLTVQAMEGSRILQVNVKRV